MGENNYGGFNNGNYDEAYDNGSGENSYNGYGSENFADGYNSGSYESGYDGATGQFYGGDTYVNNPYNNGYADNNNNNPGGGYNGYADNGGRVNYDTSSSGKNTVNNSYAKDGPVTYGTGGNTSAGSNGAVNTGTVKSTDTSSGQTSGSAKTGSTSSDKNSGQTKTWLPWLCAGMAAFFLIILWSVSAAAIYFILGIILAIGAVGFGNNVRKQGGGAGTAAIVIGCIELFIYVIFIFLAASL